MITFLIATFLKLCDTYILFCNLFTLPSSDEEDDNLKTIYMEPDIIIQQVRKKDKIEFEVVRKSNKKGRKLKILLIRMLIF